jgi:hypothetical protein
MNEQWDSTHFPEMGLGATGNITEIFVFIPLDGPILLITASTQIRNYFSYLVFLGNAPNPYVQSRG